jgi:hypothetical protein
VCIDAVLLEVVGESAEEELIEDTAIVDVSIAVYETVTLVSVLGL